LRQTFASRKKLTVLPDPCLSPPCLSTLQHCTPSPGTEIKGEPSSQHNLPSCPLKTLWHYSPPLDKSHLHLTKPDSWTTS
ncbi:hypothetical protein CHARACLAT_025139, partial [Characodon lateralis]|nr:hypothetical protein [Characodon lateralis]